MQTASPTSSTTATAPSPNRLVLRASMVSVVAATVVNLAVYGLGQRTDASLVVSPALGPDGLEVDAIKVVLTTFAYYAPGVALLAVAARRSLRSVRILAVVAAVFAVFSALGPLDASHDRATGWVLAPMHWTTGTAFVVAAVWVHRRLAASEPRGTI